MLWGTADEKIGEPVTPCADADADTDRYCHAHQDVHANRDLHSNANGNIHADAYRDVHAHTPVRRRMGSEARFCCHRRR